MVITGDSYIYSYILVGVSALMVKQLFLLQDQILLLSRILQELLFVYANNIVSYPTIHLCMHATCTSGSMISRVLNNIYMLPRLYNNNYIIHSLLNTVCVKKLAIVNVSLNKK